LKKTGNIDGAKWETEEVARHNSNTLDFYKTNERILAISIEGL